MLAANAACHTPASTEVGVCLQHHAYIEALPRDVDLPAMWPSKQVERLSNPHLLQRIQEQRQQWRAWWQGVSKACQPGNSISEADLQWALASVVSRAFKGPFIASNKQVRLAMQARVGAKRMALSMHALQRYKVTREPGRHATCIRPQQHARARQDQHHWFVGTVRTTAAAHVTARAVRRAG